MTAADYALSSCHRLRQILADKAEGKLTPSILITAELELLTKRIATLLTTPTVVLPFPERTSGDEAPTGFPIPASEDHDP